MVSRSNCPDINSLICFSFLVASQLQLASFIFQLAEGTNGGAVVEGRGWCWIDNTDWHHVTFRLLRHLGQQEIMFGQNPEMAQLLLVHYYHRAPLNNVIS